MNILSINLVVSSALVTLIWMVQLLIYPTFLDFDPETFSSCMKRHQLRITFIVLPLMVSEFIFTTLLFNIISLFSFVLIAMCVLGVWLSTALLQVPCHQKLISGKNEVMIQYLIRTNWIRTILWSLKFISLIYLLGVSNVSSM
jgi:hypothetical protein